MAEPYFGSLEGHPVRGTSAEAWIYREDDKWRPLHATEGFVNAAILTEEEFTARFGHLPDLPVTAFQDEGNPARRDPGGVC